MGNQALLVVSELRENVDNILYNVLNKLNYIKIVILKILPDLNWYCESTLGLSSPVRKALISGGLILRVWLDWPF